MIHCCLNIFNKFVNEHIFDYEHIFVSYMLRYKYEYVKARNIFNSPRSLRRLLAIVNIRTRFYGKRFFFVFFIGWIWINVAMINYIYICSFKSVINWIHWIVKDDMYSIINDFKAIMYLIFALVQEVLGLSFWT